MMQKFQRFGGAMMTPVLLFAFSGIVAGLSSAMNNADVVGGLVSNDAWFTFWYVINEGSWAVFRNMPLLFAIGLPIGLAKKAHARAVMESFITYMTFNYFVFAFTAAKEGVARDVDQWDLPGTLDFMNSTTGMTMSSGVATVDTSIVGALVVAGITVWLHNKFFDTKLPDFLGIFSGSAFVVILGFLAMIPVAFLTAYGWPIVQSGIDSMQGFIKDAGAFGVWLYVFLERMLIPTGLHHFIYTPFLFGPAVVEGGIVAQWGQMLGDGTLASADSLNDIAPWAAFSLHGNSKIFGIPGIALAMYSTAKTSQRKKVAGLLIAASLTSIVAGITEPIEFTFLFVAPWLFAIHAALAATMATIMYLFGLVGNMGGGALEFLTLNWLPLGSSHAMTYVYQFIIGLSFTAIYFFVFRTLILKFDVKTPGRSDDEEVSLKSKADYKAAKEANTDTGFKGQAIGYLELFGGPDNITDVNNCATRLRVGVKDESLVNTSDDAFRNYGAHGVVRNKKAFQIIVGLQVSSVRDEFEKLIK